MERRIQRNRFDLTGENLDRGLKAQDIFESLAKEKGWNVKHATKQQDINEHWDLRLLKDKYDVNIEVKAMKKLSRNDSDTQDEWHWIELHGVRKNDNGWLYGAKSDYIAFETKRSFLIVNRKKLIELVEKLVDFTQNVSSPKDAKYKIYKRKNRFDKITLIETSKIKEIAKAEWEKRR